jgi:GntR family transcriptional repressor for pyruvate dehydrogenase complex
MNNIRNMIIVKAPSLIEKTEAVLIEYLLSGNVEPNSYLPSELELCSRLGVGRTTLREAVKALESKGFVKRRHGKGMQVVDESHQAAADILQLLLKRKKASVRELLEVRRIVETQAAALAAERATPEQLGDLRKSLAALQSHGSSTKEDIKADLNFHLAVASATDNVLIRLIFETIRPFLEKTIISCLRVAPKNELTREYHKKMLAAIESRDPRKASAAVLEHLKGTEEMLRVAGVNEYLV